MLANTRQKFVDAGLKTVANLSNARLHDGAWDSYVEHLDGGFDEWWLTFGDKDLLSEYPQGWSRQIAQITANEAKGKITWVQPHHSGAEQPFRYAFASYLLAKGEGAAISEIEETDRYDGPARWRAEYDWDLGARAAQYRAVATNVHQRDFACGTVIVNANQTGSARGHRPARRDPRSTRRGPRSPSCRCRAPRERCSARPARSRSTSRASSCIGLGPGDQHRAGRVVERGPSDQPDPVVLPAPPHHHKVGVQRGQRLVRMP